MNRSAAKLRTIGNGLLVVVSKSTTEHLSEFSTPAVKLHSNASVFFVYPEAKSFPGTK